MKLTFEKPFDASGFCGDLGLVETATLLSFDFETGEVRFSLNDCPNVFGITLDPIPLDVAEIAKAIQSECDKG